VFEPSAPIASLFAAGTGSESPSDTAKEHLRRLLHSVADNAPHGVNPETLLLDGDPASVIAARAQGVLDLLFVGSRGYGPLRRALLGSVSAALVRDAGCPVIVTPRTAVASGRPAIVAESVHA
jgi:nucleotide-binding universal stress UspA family protein